MQQSKRDFLSTPIEYLKGVGPEKGKALRDELSIHSVGHLLHYYPFRYNDRSRIYRIADIQEASQYILLKGKIYDMQLSGAKQKRKLIARFYDESGELELIWFQGISYIEKSIKPNKEYIIYGKPGYFRDHFSIIHPEMEAAIEAEEEDTPKTAWQPVYSSTEKLKKRFLDSKGIQRLTFQLIQQLKPEHLSDFIPEDIRQQFKLLDRFTAVREIHYPQNEQLLQQAQYRLKFEEFFLLHAQVLRQKTARQQSIRGFVFKGIDGHFKTFYDKYLPFPLTEAQKRVLREIRRDSLSSAQMNRLLQGDVGSGKTIVALLSMLMAIDNGFQTCLMAPTEILAQQHSAGIRELLKEMPLKVELLIGSTKGAEKTRIKKALAEGSIDILIGTHALIEGDVQFKNLGLAVIDEQHRFGVAQRASLWAKNTSPPHILVMTATPIPRTLAMTLYGDLDVSVIDELPPGRKPIKTVHRTDSNRLRVFGFLKEEIEKGRQVYIVYPLIEESAHFELKDLMDGYESICRSFPQPQYQISILHGKMKNEDKDFEMKRFLKKQSQILVSTTVIEVGVNVPNASVMVIESAERFGLSQLHQLRGRVGRGAEQSYCILMTKDKLNFTQNRRIEIMCNSNDGFEIAEADLKLRGPGDIEGTRQSGDMELKIADIIKDAALVQLSRDSVARIFDEDPELRLENHRLLKWQLDQQRGQKDWGKIS